MRKYFFPCSIILLVPGNTAGYGISRGAEGRLY